LKNALKLDTYIDDAERGGDQQLVELFRRATSCVEQPMTGSRYPRVGEELLLAGVVQPFGTSFLLRRLCGLPLASS
jgi:hypothetical protein